MAPVTRRGKVQENCPATKPVPSEGKTGYKRYPKPPYSYLGLTAAVIWASPNKSLLLKEIYQHLADMFEFFRDPSYTGWKDSIRHNLTGNACFVKTPADPDKPRTRKNLWSLDVSKLPEDAFTVQNTSVARSGGFADDLLKHLGVDPIPPVPEEPSEVSQLAVSPSRLRYSFLRPELQESQCYLSTSNIFARNDEPATTDPDSNTTTSHDSSPSDENSRDTVPFTSSSSSAGDSDDATNNTDESPRSPQNPTRSPRQQQHNYSFIIRDVIDANPQHTVTNAAAADNDNQQLTSTPLSRADAVRSALFVEREHPDVPTCHDFSYISVQWIDDLHTDVRTESVDFSSLELLADTALGITAE